MAYYRTSSVGFGASFIWHLSGFALALAVFLYPVITWRPTGVLFTYSDIMFVAAGMLLFVSHHLSFRPMGYFTPHWLIGVTVMLAGLLLGSLVNDGRPLRWVTDSVQYLFTLVFLPMVLREQSPRRTQMLSLMMVAGVLSMELFGLVMNWAYNGSHADLKRFGDEFITGMGRLTAFLGDANFNAAVISMSLPFLIYMKLKRQIGLIPFLIGLAILVDALMLSASATGTIAAVLAVVIFIVVGRVRIAWKQLLVPALLIGVGGLVVGGNQIKLPRAFQERVLPAIENGNIEEAGTFEGRMKLIREAWSMGQRTMFVGLGADEYREVSRSHAPVHNMYFLMWTEGGAWSMVSFLYLIGILGWIAIGVRPVDRLVSARALSVLAIFFIYTNATPHMYARAWMVPVFLAIAPALSLTRRGFMMPMSDSRHIVPSFPRGRPVNPQQIEYSGRGR